jgi:hypothetical protein
MGDKTNLGEFFQSFNLGNISADYMQSILTRLAAFGDPRMNAILEGLNREIATSTQLQARGAVQRGARLSQEVSSSIGSIGGGSTGVGAVARGIGGSLAGSSAAGAQLAGSNLRAELNAQLRSQFLSQLMGLGAQGGLESALGQMSSFTQIRSQELGRPSDFQQVMQGIGALGAGVGTALPGPKAGKIPS